jgi:hypothetical protein
MALSAESERLLMHAACADSYHDFSHPPKGFGNSFNPIRTATAGKPGLYDVCLGLPATKATQSIPLSRISGNQYNPDMLHKENQMLQELFKGQTIGEGPFESRYTVPNPIEEDKKFVKNLCRAISASRIDASKNEEHKASCSFDTLLGNESYTIKLLSDSTGQTNINEIQSIQGGKHRRTGAIVDARPSKIKVSDLFRFFGSNEVNLVFDACSMNITSLFKNALPGGDHVMNVNWLINREFLNDPATKPMSDDPKVALVAPAQMKFRFLVEADPNTIAYTRYEGKADSGVLMRDKFFSLLDFKLGPLQIRAPGAHPNTRLEVFQDGNKSIYISDSPNIHNQIGECCSSIWSAITGASNNHLITAAHYQRKRSGDWFQALSCLDTGRLYYDRDGADKSPSSLKNKNITLVTHDRILLWYGLMHGLDVLFAGGKGIEEVEGGEEDEEEEAESSGSAGGPKLYLILFSNNKRTLTKEEIEGKNLATAKELLTKCDQLKADIATFNTNLREIEVERNNSIDIKFSEITEIIVKDGKEIQKGKPAKIVDLIKEFVRYSALDYNEVDISNFEKVVTNFNDVKDSTNKAEYEKKISAALLFISTFTSLRLRMDTLSNKDSIKTSDNFARDSAIFKESLFPASLIEPFDYEIRSRAPGGAERKAAVQKTVTQLAIMISSTLSIDNLRRLRRFIDGTLWNEETKRYDPKEDGFICINDIIAKNGKDPKASHLNIILTSIMTKLMDEALTTPAEAVMKVAIEAIIQNSVEVDKIVAATPEAAAAAVIGVGAEVKLPEFSQAKFESKVAAAGGKVENLKTVEVDAGEKAVFAAEVKNQAKNQEYSRKLAIADAAKRAYDNALASLEENRRIFDNTKLRKIQKKGQAQRSAENSENLDKLLRLRDENIRLEAVAVTKDEEYKKAIDEAEAIKPFIFQAPQAPPVRSIRMRISNFFNIGPTLRSWANKAQRFFNSINFEGGAKNMKGGARGDQEFWAFVLFLSYMNELVSTINGFDDKRNLDYKYFQGLSALVMSYLKDAVQTGNVIAIAQFLYIDLPNGDWGEQGDFSRFVAYAGRTISLRAVDQMVGDIPVIDKRNANLKVTNSLLQAYNSNIRLLGVYKLFKDRKLQIVKKLGNYVSSLGAKFFPKVVEPEQNLNTRAIVPRVTLPPLPNRLPRINLQNTRVLVAPVSGGKKTKRANKAKNTKKKRTVKGGRKTTRKIRF